jgi:hypothetical protein
VKIGNLYTFCRNGFCDFSTIQRWTDKLAIYLGEDKPIERQDGYKVINHKFLVEGNIAIVDKTFLALMKEVKTNV